jgi:hypothetical protein
MCQHQCICTAWTWPTQFYLLLLPIEALSYIFFLNYSRCLLEDSLGHTWPWFSVHLKPVVIMPTQRSPSPRVKRVLWYRRGRPRLGPSCLSGFRLV